MSTQRFSLATVGGCAATTIEAQLQSWVRRRLPLQGKALWYSEAWPPKVQKLIDKFVNYLRIHSCAPPVLYFAEWVDTWSAGNWFYLFDRQPDGVLHAGVAGRRFEVFWHCLPDDGRLKNRLGGDVQFPEDAWLRQRVREALDALAKTNAEQGILILLRAAIGGSALDDEVGKSFLTVPEWVSDICRDAGS
jgi:hypothetical protein